MPRVGIVGSLVWDVIHGRDPLSAPVEEWGGIAYALAGLDASLEVVSITAIGVLGDVDTLPDPLREREVAPRLRKSLEELVLVGE